MCCCPGRAFYQIPIFICSGVGVGVNGLPRAPSSVPVQVLQKEVDRSSVPSPQRASATQVREWVFACCFQLWKSNNRWVPVNMTYTSYLTRW